MGNRAIIAFEGQTVGLYLHWNGGPESVYAFLDYADQTVGKERGWDDDYSIARLFQIVGNFMGGTHSLGVANVDPANLKEADDGYGLDQGVFLVGRADDNARRRYRMAARYDGRAFTDEEIEREERLARKHAYWQGDDTIMATLATKNDQFFRAKKDA